MKQFHKNIVSALERHGCISHDVFLDKDTELLSMYIPLSASFCHTFSFGTSSIVMVVYDEDTDFGTVYNILLTGLDRDYEIEFDDQEEFFDFFNELGSEQLLITVNEVLL